MPQTRATAPNRGCFVFGELADDETVRSFVALDVGVRDDELILFGVADVRGDRVFVGPASGRTGQPVIALELDKNSELEGCAERGPVAVDGDGIVLPDTSNEGYLVAVDPALFRVRALICTI